MGKLAALQATSTPRPLKTRPAKLFAKLLLVNYKLIYFLYCEGKKIVFFVSSAA